MMILNFLVLIQQLQILLTITLQLLQDAIRDMDAIVVTCRSVKF